MILAAFHAYYVFPIEENVGETAHWLDNYVFNTFLKVFRLTVLGDFDLAELDARLNATNSKIIGSVDVDSSDWTDQYHRAAPCCPRRCVALLSSSVRYQFVIISMVITVVVMNVYLRS
ncbi:unnamed protein product [Symbiodinium natans]|uniref:Uncharacterized protein n=1 Tax=Symbiodinium natans TaxID=878477 RepID=A0A812P6G0_9DINO|nr:unnamed protein product [Symbiodinium natans]